MYSTVSTHRRRLRTSARFRVGLATLTASLGFVSGAMFAAQSAGAATLPVTNCNSSGPGSLAGVVATAPADSTVNWSLTCPTISLTAPIDLTVPITLEEGPGGGALDVDGPQGEGEVAFDVEPNVSALISDLSITSEYLGIVNEGTLVLQDCAIENDPNQQESEAIDNEGTLSIHDCQMTGNEADLNDDFSLGIENDGTATLSDCGMEGYEANYSGGSAISNEGQLNISKCSFTGNVGHFGAGAIENDGGSVGILASDFSDNEAINSTGDQIGNDAGTMDIDDTNVHNDNEGGGIYNDGTMNLGLTTIYSNVAVNGGGISNTGALSVTDSTISGNTGLQGGGGIDSGAGSATITGSTISNNSVRGTAHGGGISNKGTMTIADTTVSGNNSNDGPGGGIYNDGTMSLADSTVSSNMNEGGGGGIDNASNLSVSDSTISRNTVEGGGGGGILNTKTLVVTASTLAQNIHRSVFKDNDGGGIKNVGGTVSLAATVLAEGSSYNCSGPFIDAGYNLDDDGSCGFSAANQSFSGVPPYLGPLQDNGGPTETQEPALGSPLLDDIPMGATANGVTLCPSTDQRGVARPQGSECDIGAVELSPTPQDITSSDDATATTGQPFSFTVTTTGTPTPRLSETGTLPRKLTFTDNGNGTATISGKAKKVGSSELVFTATFGKGSGKYVVLQVFTLTVTAG